MHVDPPSVQREEIHTGRTYEAIQTQYSAIEN
jgi:hypothetical protein